MISHRIAYGSEVCLASFLKGGVLQRTSEEAARLAATDRAQTADQLREAIVDRERAQQPWLASVWRKSA